MVGPLMLTECAMPSWNTMDLHFFPPQRELSISLVAMDIPRAEASHMILNSMLTAYFRSRWVAANFGRYEYAKLAQRRPALSQ